MAIADSKRLIAEHSLAEANAVMKEALAKTASLEYEHKRLA